MPIRQGCPPPQRTALFFIALLVLDGLPGAQAERIHLIFDDKMSNNAASMQPELAETLKAGDAVQLHSLKKATNFEGVSGHCEEYDARTGLWKVKLLTGQIAMLKEENLKKRKEMDLPETDRSVDETEEEVAKFDFLRDPYKPLLKRDWRNGTAWLDKFSSLTGITTKERKKRYAESVRAVLPDSYIAESAQFALCVRLSSETKEVKNSEIDIRCTPAINLIPTLQQGNGCLSFKEVWKGLRNLVREVKVPDMNWHQDLFGNIWRKASDMFTGKDKRFQREQRAFDEKFHEYFTAQAQASSLSFVQESMSIEAPKIMKFGAGTGHTSMTIKSAASSVKWPGKNQPALASRWVLCFGRLSLKGQASLDPRRMNQHCVGFFNKEDTEEAIVGLGTSLKWDDTRLFRDRTLFHVRNEILYGTGSGDSVRSAFSLVGWDKSSKGLARTIAKLVRERIAAEGLTCPA